MALQDFLSSFGTEIARPSRFYAMINANRLNAVSSMMPSNLMLRCENAELPGRTFGTVEQKFGSNPSFRYPIHSSYTDISLSFIVSGDMTEKTYFDVWMEYINPSNTFDFSYKDDYTATITVVQLDVAGNITYAVNLLNAYPIAVNQMDLDWSSDGVHKLIVVFAYDYWQMSGMDVLNTPGILPASVQSSNDFGAPLVAVMPPTPELKEVSVANRNNVKQQPPGYNPHASGVH